MVPTWITSTILIGVIVSATIVWVGFYRLLNGLALATNQKTIALVVGTLFLGGWLLLALTLGIQGFFKADSAVRFPPISYTLLPLLIGYGWLLTSSILRKVIDGTPPSWIIGVQFYRVLGVLFIMLYALGQLPAIFALPAGIGDVLVGIAAPFVASLSFAKDRNARWIAILWNFAGIADLALAVTLGFLSSPGPFQLFALDAPNQLITAYPLVLIPTFAVPLSILLHLFSLRVLMSKKKREAELGLATA